MSALAGMLRWLILSFEPSYSVLLMNQLLHGATYALLMAAAVTFVYEMGPDGMKTTGQTLYTVVASNLSSIIGSNVGGWIMDQQGFSVLFQLASVLSLLGALGFFLMARRYKLRSTSSADMKAL
nr:MFS transporter [Paenibacillus cremeus]